MQDGADRPNVTPTGYALLGVLSYHEELSGYDLKKWTEWSLRFFYGSPAYSQIYTELKKLEGMGLVTSRVETDGGARSKRLYKITEAGSKTTRDWADDGPVDPPQLKHNPLLRITFGHLTNPRRLKEIIQEHVAYADRMQREAATEARWAEAEPAWAYGRVALLWAERYYAAERELALKLIKDLDEAEEAFKATAAREDTKPLRDYWYEIERRVKAEEAE
ncbi:MULTISPECIES: PadR family transcriptional regulator [Mycobacteriaceae]|uniref:PadR family transcriptional regulator n=1 Tax=Mycobacteriaceae TaxID=1762 RepID=UPI0007FF96F6|nr:MULTISPECIES: PadR family transcriptional regulator [Mycobacteriaceae]MCK0175452.1 helix-turn-helix transcriptional regulator [Mycolicibacterium sp. F2034L]OBB59955.1 PadR family transcriptional regulator [Mycobacterium sp. 852013-51886_SCH5428379]